MNAIKEIKNAAVNADVLIAKTKTINRKINMKTMAEKSSRSTVFKKENINKIRRITCLIDDFQANL